MSPLPPDTRKPHDSFATHLIEARVEDARFMLDNGDPIERVALRLDVEVGTLIRTLERHKDRTEA